MMLMILVEFWMKVFLGVSSCGIVGEFVVGFSIFCRILGVVRMFLKLGLRLLKVCL